MTLCAFTSARLRRSTGDGNEPLKLNFNIQKWIRNPPHDECEEEKLSILEFYAVHFIDRDFLQKLQQEVEEMQDRCFKSKVFFNLIDNNFKTRRFQKA